MIPKGINSNMKTMTFNFSHPFLGNAILYMPGKQLIPSKVFSLDSKESNIVEIPLNDCKAGKWMITLNWELNSRMFIYQQEFEIN